MVENLLKEAKTMSSRRRMRGGVEKIAYCSPANCKKAAIKESFGQLPGAIVKVIVSVPEERSLVYVVTGACQS